VSEQEKQNETAPKSRVLALAQQIDYAKREQDEAERTLVRLKTEYETNRQNALAKLHRAHDKLSDLSKELTVEAKALHQSFTPTPERAVVPVSGAAPPAKRQNMTKEEAERKFGPVTWKKSAGDKTLSLRREWLQFITNRPATTMKEFQEWFVAKGGPSKSASPVFNVLKAYAEEKGWPVTGKGGRGDPLTIRHAEKNGIIEDLAVAGTADKERLIQEARAAEEASR
jgi:hypothetical protein